MNDIIPSKCCVVCGTEYPDTPEYFPIYKVRGKRYHRNACRSCWRKSRKAHSDDTREADRTRRRKWRKENPDKLKLYHQQDYENNRPRIQAYQKQWGEENKVRISIKQHEAYIKNREIILNRSLEYQRTHPEYVRARANRRRARELAAEGDGFTVKDIRLQYKSQRGKCWHCGVRVGSDYHCDHLYPLVKGGKDTARNMVISCPSCNCSKGGKPTWEWNGRLL